jgi:hypothetical protein
MRQSQLTVLERLRNIEQDFFTEPFETAWAGKGSAFIHIHEAAHENDYLEVSPQISGDGLNWFDSDDDSLVLRGDDSGGFLHLETLTGAVRFKIRMSHGANFKVTIQLYVKE